MLRRLFGWDRTLFAGKKGCSLEQARIPDQCRAYVVGDIHGRADLLAEILEAIAGDARSGPDQKHLIFLGDFVDRGHQSREVVEIVLGIDLPGFDCVCLQGNHEEFMLRFLDDPIGCSNWLQIGGDATLLSYGVSMKPGVPTAATLRQAAEDLKEAIPSLHFSFFAQLQEYFDLGDYMFVHAGVDPDRPLDKQRPQDLRWIRDRFVDHEDLYDKIVVHGHSITETPEFHRNRIALDTGAYYSGRLTCLVLEGGERRILQTGTR